MYNSFFVIMVAKLIKNRYKFKTIKIFNVTYFKSYKTAVRR